jgi:glycopeptide antibiotics resistance protein
MKKIKMTIFKGAVLSTLGVGIGYVLYTLKQEKNAKLARKKERFSETELEEMAWEACFDRSYIKLDMGKKGEKQK